MFPTKSNCSYIPEPPESSCSSHGVGCVHSSITVKMEVGSTWNLVEPLTRDNLVTKVAEGDEQVASERKSGFASHRCEPSTEDVETNEQHQAFGVLTKELCVPSKQQMKLKKECHWTAKEKKIALCGMNICGLHDMKGIASMIGSKSESEVTFYLTKVLKRAQFRARVLNRKAYNFSKKKLDKLSLLRWKKNRRQQLTKIEVMIVKIDALRSSLLLSQRPCEDRNPSALARALLMVSKFEEHPLPMENGVDFSETSYDEESETELYLESYKDLPMIAIHYMTYFATYSSLAVIGFLRLSPKPLVVERNGAMFGTLLGPTAAYALLSKIVSGKLIDKSMWPNATTYRFVRESFQKLLNLHNTECSVITPPNHSCYEKKANMPGTSSS